MPEVSSGCPLCTPVPSSIIAENLLAVALHDAYPVSRGHAIIVPRRHVASWFDTSSEEREALLALVDQVKTSLGSDLRPDGYNIGVNIGEAAGQTVMHVHLHLIPRYAGDVDDPAGGVRFVVPERGNYRRPGHIPRAST